MLAGGPAVHRLANRSTVSFIGERTMSLWEQNQLTSGVDPSKTASAKTKRNNALVISVILLALAVVIWMVSR
jgi:hypothetical protein